jgi:hypothetical protein
VRSTAMVLKEFTIADLVAATGMKPESVRTVVQKMRQEGFLTSTRLSQPGRGRPALYQLTEQPEKIDALADDIEGFYPPAPVANRPRSPHYLIAHDLLDQAVFAGLNRRTALLSDAAEALEIASLSEGGAPVSDQVNAFFEYERARLSYLQGEYELAETQFKHIRRVFEDYDYTMVELIDEFLLCLAVERQEYTAIPTADLARLDHLLRILRDPQLPLRSPVLSLLVRLSSRLLATQRQRAKIMAGITRDYTATDRLTASRHDRDDSYKQIVPPDQFSHTPFSETMTISIRRPSEERKEPITPALVPALTATPELQDSTARHPLLVPTTSFEAAPVPQESAFLP